MVSQILHKCLSPQSRELPVLSRCIQYWDWWQLGSSVKLSNPDKPRQREEAGERQDGCGKYLRGTSVPRACEGTGSPLLWLTHQTTLLGDAVSGTWPVLEDRRLWHRAGLPRLPENRSRACTCSYGCYKKIKAMGQRSGDRSQTAVFAKGLDVTKGY